ncbi:MAG: methyltransferase domain-containing protein [Myxococcota bacterium]
MLVSESVSGERKRASEQAQVLARHAGDEAGHADVNWFDPAPYANPGDRVLVLGAANTTLCFSLAQVVGKRGQVVGIDSDGAAIASARAVAPEAFRRLGFSNVTFCNASHSDLRLDREAVNELLQKEPIRHEADLEKFEAAVRRVRTEQPLVPDSAADLVVFDATSSPLAAAPSLATFREIHRVLTHGGRCVLAVLTTDEPIAGEASSPYGRALLESRVFEDLEAAGLYGISLLARDEEPVHRVGDVQFRRLRFVAYKGKEGPCWERVQAVLLKGPFRQVTDDDGHVFVRGVRTAVCEKTFRILSRPPYNSFFELIEPEIATSPDTRVAFPCASAPIVRKPSETKTGRSDQHQQTNGGKAAKSCC